MMTSNKYPNKCPICLNKEFEFIHGLNASYWCSDAHELRRKEIEFKLVECKRCKHIICVGDYSAAMLSKLYPSTYESSAIKTKPDLYLDIIEFNSTYLKEFSELYLADLGGGTGELLIEIGKSKIGPHVRELVVFDQFVYQSNDEIKFKKWDFNYVKKNSPNLSNFNYGFCVHTLEHILDPREFLEFIFTNTKKRFFMYIEVPANELININASVTVIHPSHIHYFTLTNLITLVTSIGFKIIKSEIKETSGVPRIKCIVKKEEDTKLKIINYFNDRDERREHVTRIIIEDTLKVKGKVALWGVGNELYELIKKDENLKKGIQIGDILLIDSTLAGKILYGIRIYAPQELIGKVNNIIVTPMELATRESIHQNAVKIGFSPEIIIDPYEHQMSRAT